MYIDKSIKEYLALVASHEPFPGGGSVAALVASLGSSLTVMTANFSFDKKYFKELDPSIQKKMRDRHADIQRSIRRLNRYIDEDAEGFAQVIEAYKKDEKESKKENEERLEKSYREALTAPLKSSRECLEILKAQAVIVEYGNKDTITDVGVGIVLVYAALEGSLMSVKINLAEIEDLDYQEQILIELDYIYNEATTIKNRLHQKIENTLNESF